MFSTLAQRPVVDTVADDLFERTDEWTSKHPLALDSPREKKGLFRQVSHHLSIDFIRGIFKGILAIVKEFHLSTTFVRKRRLTAGHALGGK